MADHDVTLTYGPGNAFSADPPSIAVRQGETIAFHLADASLPGTIRITFHDPGFFSSRKQHFRQDGVFLSSDGEVTVAQALTRRTTYHCELLGANNQVIGHSHENGGGECIPAN